MQLKLTKPNAFQMIMIQASALPGLSHVIALTWNGTESYKHEPTVPKRQRSPDSRIRHLPLVPYCTNQSSECQYAFLSSPTD